MSRRSGRKTHSEGFYYSPNSPSPTPELPSTPLEPTPRPRLPLPPPHSTPPTPQQRSPQEDAQPTPTPTGGTSVAIDRFSTLSPEALATVFEVLALLNKHSTLPIEPILFPISKRLRQHTDRLLYRDILIDSVQSLKLLCRTIKSNSSPFLGTLVESLTIEIDEDAGQYPSEGTLALLLSALCNLRVLHIDGHQRAANVVLSGAVHGPAMRRKMALKELEELAVVGIVYDHEPDPLDPRIYSHLAHCPKLHTLKLDVSDSGITSSPRKPLKRQFDAITNATVQVLSLTGPLSSSPSTTSLLATFPLLHTLSLTDTSPNPNLTLILTKISNPLAYTSLTLSHDHCPVGTPSLAPFTIIRFRSLASLTLGPGTFPVNMDYNIFHWTPNLSTLGFSLGADIKLAALLSLLRPGLTKHATLRTLVLDVVDGSFPIPPSEDDHTEATTTAKGQPGQLPRWTADVSPSRARQFLKNAKVLGIEVKGSIRWALAVQDVSEGRPIDWEELIGTG
ncbi:hypothetical protein RQP46_001724 [Phenoliferia psychrophenolica]